MASVDDEAVNMSKGNCSVDEKEDVVGTEIPVDRTQPCNNESDKFSDSSIPENMTKKPHPSPATKYCQTLRQSLWAYQNYQAMNWLQMNTMCAFYSMMNANLLQQQQSNVRTVPPTRQTRPQNQAQSQNAPSQPGNVYSLATLPQRVAAETIDFLLLFFVKLAVTMIAIEHLGILNKPDFGFSILKELDGELTLEELSEFIIWAFFYRLNVCLFEALCLRRGIGHVGGATPGKRFMGIRVVSCQYILDVGEDRIRVIPAQNIGFLNALVRSVVKNFSLTFFFPACFTVLFFQHNRAAYDHIANCVVVKDPNPRR